MGKREIITGGVVVLSMAVGFGGMLATRLRNVANKDTRVSDEQGVKDALAAFHNEKSAGFPAKSSLMEFRDSAPPVAAASSAAPLAADNSTLPSAMQPSPVQPSAVQPSAVQPAANAGSLPDQPATPPSWAGANPGDNRYGAVAATDPMTSPTSSPMMAGSDPGTPPTTTDPNAAAPNAAASNDPFRRSPMGSAPLGSPSESGAPTPQSTPASQPTPSPDASVANSGAPATTGAAWPPTSDAGAGLVSNPNGPPPTPQADPPSQPGMMPLQQMPVVTAVAAAPADPDPRYNNDYRRRDYRDSSSDTTAIPPAATPGSTDAQAQYQYVSPSPPMNSGPPPAQRTQYDTYGREVNRDPDPTNSDTSTQPPASQQPYGQPPYGQQPGGQMPNSQTPNPTAGADNWPANPPRVPRDDGPETYTLGPNESYWTVSEKVYGTGAYFKAIEEHNRERYPYSDQLRVGDVISTPRIGVLQEKYPDLCPKQRQAPAAQSTAQQVSMRGQMGGRVYEVQKGDTLFDIARDELGKASRWAEIYELNRDVIGNDVDLLSPGMKLRMPGNGGSRSDPLTTQSRQPYNR